MSAIWGRRFVRARSYTIVALLGAFVVSAITFAGPTSAAGSIALRSASSASNPTSTSLTISAPAGATSGDVLVATVDARGNPTFVAPAGWNLIRLDIEGYVVRKATYFKVATGSEPASYTWTWSGAQAAAGGILDYINVDTSAPVVAHSGAVYATSTASIVAPSLTTDVAGSMIVGLYDLAQNTTITPSAGMTERFEAVSNAGTYPVVSEAADQVQQTAGASGDRTATAGRAAQNIGQLIALRPAGGSSPSPSPSPTATPTPTPTPTTTPKPSPTPTPTPTTTPTPTPTPSVTPTPSPTPSPTPVPGRLYSTTSFWNTPIASNPAVDPGSAAMVQGGLVAYASNANFANTDAWGVPIVFAKSTDTLYNIGCTKYDCSTSISVRIPAGAKPTTGSDHHLVVVDGNTEVDMWLASYNSTANTWTAGSRYKTDANGWGAMCALGQHCNGSVAAGFAAFGGIPRPEEFGGSVIPHALTITTPNTLSGYIACPATHTDGKYSSTGALPEGARLQLDPAFNVDAQPWPAWKKTLARTLQVYGAYVSDTGGTLAIRGEADLNREGAWQAAGIPEGPTLKDLPWSQFRVLKLTKC